MNRSILLVVLTLAGCGGGGSSDDTVPGPGPEVTGMLRPVRDAAELENSLRNSLRASRPDPDVVTTAAPGIDASAFSNTNTVESGVDEIDLVRYDGGHLYIAAPTANGAHQIRIVRADAPNATAAEVATIPLPANDFVQGLYVNDGRLTVVSSGANFMPWGRVWSMIAVWAPSDMHVRVFDVSNPAQPTSVMTATIDGVFVASRRIGDRVYLVSRHAPSAFLTTDLRARIDSLTTAELLPQITIAGNTRSLIEPARCYVTNAAQPNLNLVVTSITSFSLVNPQQITNTCYNENADGVYVSEAALYLAQPHSRNGGPLVTRIHKFSLDGVAPDYSGSVEVEGAVWTGGQNDFRMSERNGNLRVLTSEWTSDPADNVDHRLYVLRPKAAGRALEVIGQLPNALRPAEIGKPNERLFGVRFVDDRAYAVTFLQIDPLYVIDLADPRDPRIAGQLELPGVSDYLHPVAESLLLGLGTEDNRIKLELFDVSVLSQPQSRGSLLVGQARAYSEANWDRHAFTYLPAETADRGAIPVTEMTGWPQQIAAESSLLQFEVLGKQVPASAQLRDAGRVNPPPLVEADRYNQGARSFLHGDTVFYVRNGKVWASRWQAPGQVAGPF